MIHIILLVLKIIGLILAAILGIILLFILSVLFVPVHYRIKAGYRKEISADIRVRWLFPALYMRFCFADEKLAVKFMLFGIPVYNSKRKRRERKQRKVRKKAYKVRAQEKQDIVKEPESPLFSEEPLSDSTESVIFEAEEESFFYKLKSLWKKIAGLFKKIPVTLKNLFSKAGQVKRFVQNEENRKGMGRIWEAFKKSAAHILPKKFKADVRFGTGDPCTTGQALGVCAVFYGWYQDSIHIVPDFEQAVLEGELYAAGRIRMVTLLIIGIKLILDKDMQNLIHNFKQFKEEL